MSWIIAGTLKRTKNGYSQSCMNTPSNAIERGSQLEILYPRPFCIHTSYSSRPLQK